MSGKTPIVDARTVDASKINLNDYSTLPPGTKITEIRNRKEGLQEFLKRDDSSKSIDLDRLRKQYMQDTNVRTDLDNMPRLDEDNLERYITK